VRERESERRVRERQRDRERGKRKREKKNYTLSHVALHEPYESIITVYEVRDWPQGED
jgi:hypothetical protein